MSRNPQIYVGHIPHGVRTDDIYDTFEKFGKIREVNFKSRYAFVVSIIFHFLIFILSFYT